MSDVPYVCNNGCAVAVDGRQPFLPVGIPAVNSGSVLGNYSLSGAVARVRAARSRSAAAGSRRPG